MLHNEFDDEAEMDVDIVVLLDNDQQYVGYVTADFRRRIAVVPIYF
jgi:hypothetical protein